MAILKSKETEKLKKFGLPNSSQGFRHYFLVGHHGCVELTPVYMKPKCHIEDLRLIIIFFKTALKATFERQGALLLEGLFC